MTISAFRPPDDPGRAAPAIPGEVGLRPRARRAAKAPPPEHPWPIRRHDPDPQPAALPITQEVGPHPGTGAPTIIGEVGLHPTTRTDVTAPPVVRPSSLRRRARPASLPGARPITGEVALHPAPRPVTAPPLQPWVDQPWADQRWARRLRAVATTETPPVEHVEPAPLWKRTLSVMFTLAIVAMVVFLWPARLGGSTRLVIVTGDSMNPTYDFGDLVVTRDQGTPDVGDVVVFAVPEGTAKGILVIHRVIDVDESGIFHTQGDNRDRADVWDLTEDDIVGRPLLPIPKGGYVVWYIQQWWVVAIVVGLLALFLLWPDRDEDEDDEEVDDLAEAGTRYWRHHGAAIDDAELIARVLIRSEDTVQLPRTTVWSETPIADEVMMDAIAWLDEQLELISQSPAR